MSIGGLLEDMRRCSSLRHVHNKKEMHRKENSVCKNEFVTKNKICRKYHKNAALKVLWLSIN